MPNSITSIGNNAFAYNELSSITIPNSVISIEGGTFKNNNLASIAIPNTVTSIGYAAFKENSLTNVSIPNTIRYIESEVFYGNNLTSVVIPNSVTSIGKAAFQANNLDSIIIPNSVLKINEYAFYDNDSLNSFILPTPEISGTWSVGTAGEEAAAGEEVTKLGNTSYNYILSASNYTPADSDFLFENGEIKAYYGPGGNITIPSTINGESVTAIGISSFPNKNLASVTIPNSVTSIGRSAFSNNKLTNVVIPNSVTYLGSYAFHQNSDLTDVVISNSITSIEEYTFNSCGLTSVTIPNSVTSIGKYAFQLNSFTNVTLPESLLVIGQSAFINNDINNLIIPNSVISIGGSAFFNNNLTSVDIPNSVTYIGGSAFYGNDLTSFVLPSPASGASYTVDGWLASNDAVYAIGHSTTDLSKSYSVITTPYEGKVISVLLEGVTGSLEVTGDQTLLFDNFGSVNFVAEVGQNLTITPILPQGYESIPSKLMLTDIQKDSVFVFTSKQVSSSNYEKYIEETNVFPNPSTGNFKIELKEEKPTNISIYDLTGKLITRLPNKFSQEVNIDVENGIYFLQIETTRGLEQIKILIEK